MASEVTTVYDRSKENDVELDPLNSELYGYTVSDLEATPAVDRSKISSLATMADIRPGAIVDFCNTLGVRIRATVLSEIYTRTLPHFGLSISWFDVQRLGSDQVAYVSSKDTGITPIYGERYVDHFWTELVQAAE